MPVAQGVNTVPGLGLQCLAGMNTVFVPPELCVRLKSTGLHALHMCRLRALLSMAGPVWLSCM